MTQFCEGSRCSDLGIGMASPPPHRTAARCGGVMPGQNKVIISGSDSGGDGAWGVGGKNA